MSNTRSQIYLEKPPLPAPTHQQNLWSLITGCWQHTGGTYRFACSNHSIKLFELHEYGLPAYVCSKTTCRQRKKEPQLCDYSAHCFGCEVLSSCAGTGSAGKQPDWGAVPPNATFGLPSMEGNPLPCFTQGPRMLLPPRCSARGSDVKRTESKYQTSHNR